MNISRTTVRKDVAGGLKVKFYGMRRGPFYQRQAKGSRSDSKEPPGGVGDGGSGLPAHLTTAFWTNLCGASLGYWSMQSLTTKSKASSKR
jgi:hypothetical protein